MLIDINDFVVIQIDNKKKLVQVISKEESSGLELYEVKPADQPKAENFTVYKSAFLANLGKKPTYGSAYGVTVEIFLKKKALLGVEFFIFRHLEKEEIQEFTKAYKAVVNTLEEHQLELYPYEVEIRQPKGKMEGFYKTRKEQDLICFRPKQFQNCQYLIFHELAHSIWYRNMSLKTRSKWILKYEQALAVEKIQEEEIQELLDNFYEQKITIKAFKSSLSDREKDILSIVLDHYKSIYFLENEHIDTLILTDQELPIINLQESYLSDLDLVLTDYAKTSPEEFFAEAFSIYFTMKLPDEIEKMMEQTLKLCKNVRYS